MNAQSLHALIIDRHFGELSPEATELLAAHLAQNPEAQAEADRILGALAITEQTVLEHPELVQMGSGDKKNVPAAQPVKKGWFTPAVLAKAAAMVLLLGVSGVTGFFAGRTQPLAPPSPTVASANVVPQTPRSDSPWASYRLAHDPNSGELRAVRVKN
jgi:anti-sigma factor RsiW